MTDKQKQAIRKQLARVEAAFVAYKQVLHESLSCDRETVSPISAKEKQQELAQRNVWYLLKNSKEEWSLAISQYFRLAYKRYYNE